ncbi:MAG TPA: VWA domain-containing protein [Vicinamibacterales bacterium]
MRHIAVAVALLVSVLQDQRAVFRSAAEAVRVDALATDGWRPVTGLTAHDFELWDSGVAQKIESVDISELPFSVMLALDTSTSMKGAALRQLQDGARAALDVLRPDDRASILTFNSAAGRPTPWTADRGSLGAAIEQLSTAGTTSLFDAAFAAMVQRDPEPGRRNLLILFTDGDDTSSWLPDGAAYDLAARTDIVVYGITTDATTSAQSGALRWRSGVRLALRQPIVSSTDFLSGLAERTGGKHLRSTATDLRRTFTQIVSEFRTRYVLWYRPEGVPATGWHPIDVRLKSGRGQLTARRGYER